MFSPAAPPRGPIALLFKKKKCPGCRAHFLEANSTTNSVPSSAAGLDIVTPLYQPPHDQTSFVSGRLATCQERTFFPRAPASRLAPPRASDAPPPLTPPYDGTHSSVPASVEAHDRFLDLLTATACEAAVDANASEPSFLQDSKRTDVVRGRPGVQWTLGGLGKKNL